MTDFPFTHDAYRDLLSVAVAEGWNFVDYETMVQDKAVDDARPRCVLRHDCDNDLVASLATARIERETGVRATYFILLRSAMYNPFSLPFRRIIDEIRGMGHFIGLHFDETAYDGADVDAVAAAVEVEREWAAREFNTDVQVVSFHQPGPRILENRIKTTCINTYDRADMAGVHYVSDSNKSFRGQDPAGLFRSKAFTRLQFLVHPEWWTAMPVGVTENWAAMFENNFKLIEQETAGREAAFYKRLHMVIS